MANNGTKIYAHERDGVMYGVTLQGDVYSVLGLQPVNGSYSLGYVCSNKHGKINPWAKYKPVCHTGGVGVSTPTSPKYIPNWWKAKYPPGVPGDGNCGITGVVNQPGETWRACSDESSKYVYRAPQGGLNECFRLPDFNGYNDAAPCPVRMRWSNKFELTNLPGMWAEVTAVFDEGISDTDDSCLKLTDIIDDTTVSLGASYLTVAVVRLDKAGKEKGSPVFLQAVKSVSESMDDLMSSVRVPLTCDHWGEIVTGLGIPFEAGDGVGLYAFLAPALANATDLDYYECRRSADYPSIWSSLYLEDRPARGYTVSYNRVYHEVEAVLSGASAVMGSDGARGILQMQSITAGLRYTPATAITCRVLVTVRNSTDDYLLEEADALGGGTLSIMTSANGTATLRQLYGAQLPFACSNAEIAANGYGADWEVEVSLVPTSDFSDYAIRNTIKGTATLRNGVWTCNF